jgi:hypothetical protein
LWGDSGESWVWQSGQLDTRGSSNLKGERQSDEQGIGWEGLPSQPRLQHCSLQRHLAGNGKFEKGSISCETSRNKSGLLSCF